MRYIKDRTGIERHTPDGQWKYVCMLHDSLFGGGNPEIRFEDAIRRDFLFEFAQEKKVDLETSQDQALVDLVSAALDEAPHRGGVQQERHDFHREALEEAKGKGGPREWAPKSREARVFSHKGVDVYWRDGSPSLFCEVNGVILSGSHKNDLIENIDMRLDWDRLPKKRVIWLQFFSKQIEHGFQWNVFKIAKKGTEYYRVSRQDGPRPQKMYGQDLSGCYEYDPRLLLYLEEIQRRVDELIRARELLQHVVYRLDGRLVPLPHGMFERGPKDIVIAPAPCFHCGCPKNKHCSENGHRCPGYEPDQAWIKAFEDAQ